MSRALKLASWVDSGRETTESGVLRPAIATQACAALGIELPSGKKLRSAQDVPDLMRAWDAALGTGLISIFAKRAYGIGFQDLADDAAVALEAWLRGAAVPFGLSDDLCAQCLTVLAMLAEAGTMVVSDLLEAVRSRGADDAEDAEEHGLLTLAHLFTFGAVVTVDEPGTVVSLAPLGRMLADSVSAAFAPAPDDNASAVVSLLGDLPPGTAILYARNWLAARTPVSAASELFDFAESAAPRQRATAFALADQIGPDAAPAWRERAEEPGYGAYVRFWLDEHGEPVPGFPRDDAWLAAEAFASLLADVPPELTAMALTMAMEQGGVQEPAEAVVTLEESGHPDAGVLIDLLGGRRAEPRPAPAHGGAKPYQLMITLDEVDDPPVWRRVAVPGSATLADLHNVIQAALGWENDHMHVFHVGRRELASATPLREVLPRRRSRIQYTYDFGDNWEHDILSEGYFQNELDVTLPACLDGSGACPPEDCGGAWQYEYLKSEVLTDPDHEEHYDMLQWLGLDSADDFDPAAFSLDEVNARLASFARFARPHAASAGADVVRLQPRAKASKAKRKR